jgi:hypothetical protein
LRAQAVNERRQQKGIETKKILPMKEGIAEHMKLKLNKTTQAIAHELTFQS